MTDNDSKISRRRILGGIATVGIASAAAGAGTFAAFSDTEQSNNNSVTAGTLNLTVDGGETAVSVLGVSNAVPGETGTGTAITLANDGTVSGSLDITVNTITSAENGTNDPESSDADEGTGVELESLLTVTVKLGGTSVFSDTANNISDGQSIVTGETLNNGSPKDFQLEYTVDSGAGNEIQSDSVSIDFDFTLTS